MTDSAISANDPTRGEGPPSGDHVDKYNDPRARITRRGILIGVAVAVVAVVAALGSIAARRTRLEKTTDFWGEETINALQLAERIELLPRGASRFEPVELSSTPGLGHLRRALLDERNFDWTTTTAKSVAELCPPEKRLEKDDSMPIADAVPACIQLRLTDPTAERFGTIEIDLDLAGGWVGPADGSQRVRATEWVQPKLRNYFKTIMSVSQLSYDFRDEEE